MPILKPEVSIFPHDLLTASERTGDSSRHWLVAHTKPRQEKSLGRQILSYEIPFYLPLIPKDQLYGRKRVRSFCPLFSGYVFLYASSEERERCVATRCVAQILPVDDCTELVRDLRQVHELISADAPLTVERRLSSGDRVRVKAGALAGLEGCILRRNRETRLVIAVNYLQQGVSVEIDDYLCEPV